MLRGGVCVVLFLRRVLLVLALLTLLPMLLMLLVRVRAFRSALVIHRVLAGAHEPFARAKLESHRHEAH